MRQYIRPLLFAIARLGLLCSVLSWIAALYSTVWLQFPLQRREMLIEVHPRGYVCVGWDVGPYGVSGIDGPWALEVVSEPDGGIFCFDFFTEPPVKDDVSFALNIPGAVAGRARNYGSFVMVRHWFVVTTFAVFFGILKRVYRNKTESAVTVTQ